MIVFISVLLTAAPCLAADRDVPAGRLIRVEYLSAGGMTGGHDRYELARSGDAAILMTDVAEWHNTPPDLTERDVPASSLDDIEAIFRQNGMHEWPDLPKDQNGIFAHDAPTWSMTFEFDGEAGYFDRRFSIRQDQAFPPSRALHEIFDIIRHAKKNSSSVRVPPPPARCGRCGWISAPGATPNFCMQCGEKLSPAPPQK